MHFSQFGKKTNFLLVIQNSFFQSWTNESLFSFSTAQTEKLRNNRGNNWGKQDQLFGGLMSQIR